MEKDEIIGFDSHSIMATFHRHGWNRQAADIQQSTPQPNGNIHEMR